MTKHNPGRWIKIDTGSRVGSRVVTTTCSSRVFTFNPAPIDAVALARR